MLRTGAAGMGRLPAGATPALAPATGTPWSPCCCPAAACCCCGGAPGLPSWLPAPTDARCRAACSLAAASLPTLPTTPTTPTSRSPACAAPLWSITLPSSLLAGAPLSLPSSSSLSAVQAGTGNLSTTCKTDAFTQCGSSQVRRRCSLWLPVQTVARASETTVARRRRSDHADRAPSSRVSSKSSSASALSITMSAPLACGAAAE